MRGKSSDTALISTITWSSTIKSKRYPPSNFTSIKNRNGQFRRDAPDHPLEKNKSLLEIKGLGGDEDARKLWKKLQGYHRRSLAETGMYRFKTLFGRDLKCRTFQGQQSEAYVKAKAL
jgi:hypothetical protein